MLCKLRHDPPPSNRSISAELSNVGYKCLISVAYMYADDNAVSYKAFATCYDRHFTTPTVW